METMSRNLGGDEAVRSLFDDMSVFDEPVHHGCRCPCCACCVHVVHVQPMHVHVGVTGES